MYINIYDLFALIKGVAYSVCGSAERPAQICDNDRTVVDHKSVSSKHTLGGIIFRKINSIVGFGKNIIIRIFLCLSPFGRLCLARQGEDEIYLGKLLAQLKHRQGGESVKPERSARYKGVDPAADELSQLIVKLFF